MSDAPQDSLNLAQDLGIALEFSHGANQLVASVQNDSQLKAYRDDSRLAALLRETHQLHHRTVLLAMSAGYSMDQLAQSMGMTVMMTRQFIFELGQVALPTGNLSEG